MKSIDDIICSVLLNIANEEDKNLVHMFDELYKNLEESPRSNLVKILIGHGAIKKENGKLVKDGAKIAEVKKNLGIK